MAGVGKDGRPETEEVGPAGTPAGGRAGCRARRAGSPDGYLWASSSFMARPRRKIPSLIISGLALEKFRRMEWEPPSSPG